MAQNYEEARRADLPVASTMEDNYEVEAAAIRAGIEHTRERMSHTLDELGEQLNPDRIKAQVKQNVRQATIGRAENMARYAADRFTETQHGLVDTVRENPIPAAMIGIGLGWLLMNSRRQESYGYGESYNQGSTLYGRTGYNTSGYGTEGTYGSGNQEGGIGDKGGDLTGQVTERVSNLTNQAGERVGDVTSRLGERVNDVTGRTQEVLNDTMQRARSTTSHLVEETRHRTSRLEDRFQSTLQESPLAVGAAVIALGVAAGLTVPVTEREVEIMGDTRDELFDRARELATETTGKIQQVAERVVDEAQTVAKEEALEQGLMASGSSERTSGSSQGYGSSSGSSGSSGIGNTGIGNTGIRNTDIGNTGNSGMGASGQGGTMGRGATGSSGGAGKPGTGGLGNTSQGGSPNL